MNELRGLRVDVLRSAFGDCTNGGVTSWVKTFVLIDPARSVDGGCAVTGPEPVLKVVRRSIYGQLYVHAEPVTPVPDGHVGYMAGGNFVYTSDSRYRELTGVPYPISVHDRSETPELYEALSR